jgi:hypothetical protein
LSENDFISTTDHYIGTRTWNINPNNFITPVATLNIPSSQLPGQYHVGWIMTSSVAEYTNDNNTVAIGPEKLTVTLGATTPPAATLVAPNGTISDTTPTYTWNAVANATYYYLWVNDSTGNKIKTWYTSAAVGCASGTGTCSVTPATTLASGAGKWWIQTWNPSGSGFWSAPMGFTVSSSVPPATTLASPSGVISDTTPAYTWNAVTNATYYYLWVNDSTGNKIKTWHTAAAAGCASGTGTCSVTPATTLASGAGKWWIQTWNPSGYGLWSAPMGFTVSSSTVPPAATLVAPSGAISDTTPTYTWNAVANATYYYLWVNDSSGNKIKTWYTAAAAGCSSGTGTCSVTPAKTLAGGAGRWWIQTWNPSGYGPWSAVKNFSVI